MTRDRQLAAAYIVAMLGAVGLMAVDLFGRSEALAWCCGGAAMLGTAAFGVVTIRDMRRSLR